MTQVLAAVHEDGHVAAIAVTGQQEQRLQRHFTTLAGAGLTGWHLDRISAGLAIVAELEHEKCQACQLTFACGCTADQIGRDGCPHGTPADIAAAARQSWTMP